MLSRRLLRIKVIKSLYAHLKSNSDSLTQTEKSLNESIDKSYELYHLMMWLIVEIKGYGEERIEIARNKKLPSQSDLNPNMNFVNNRLVAQIENDENLKSYLKRKKLNWKDSQDLIKLLYNKMLSSSYYEKYCGIASPSYADDARFLVEFFSKEVEDCQLLEDILEEKSILWNDDLGFAIIMVIKTVESMRESQTTLHLLPQFKSDEDKDFARYLLRRALVSYDENLTYIEKFTQNWDVERIAFLDNIIMATAMAEMMEFETIPVKVTLDEYIEISKYYSTPGSSPFINGVLDKIVETLKNEDKIKKSGRGLN